MPQTGSRARSPAAVPCSCACVIWLEPDTSEGYIAVMRREAKATTLKRLSRIEGQVRGLARMVEDDRYCIDIVTQIGAVRAALRKVEEEVIRDHVGHCVEGA